MRLGLYLVASLILMAIVGIFVYTVNPNEYGVEEFGISMTMPLAVWFVLPMFALMVASAVHMMFYGTKNFFKFKKWEKDTITLEDTLYWSILHEPKNHAFNLPVLKETVSFLNHATIKVDGDVYDISEKLKGALALVRKIESGEHVDLKLEKLDKVLSLENPLVIENFMNRLRHDEAFAEEILQSKEAYSDKVFKEALKMFSSKATFPQAKKYVKLYNKESFYMLLTRSRKENLGLTKDILDEFIVSLESSLLCADYLKIATLMMSELSPDENLALWREYEGKYSDSQIAYLYLLFDYEMVDKAGEYLDEHDEGDFKRFRALLELKKLHKNYKIEDMMDIRHICEA
jgi:hypothetical protein